MAKGYTPKGPRQIAEIANPLVDPVLARRAGISTGLISAWDEIAGETFAASTRPEKIRWPKREPGADERFSPGELVIACEGARALFLMHQEAEILSRINAYFGFPAVSRMRIVQKPVSNAPRRSSARPLDALQRRRLSTMLDGVEDGPLRTALTKLGEGVLGQAPKRR